MNLLILAACFLVIFCPPKRAHRHHTPAAVADEEPTDPHKRRTDGNRACSYILKDYDGNQDAFVSQFVVPQQRHVLECIDRGQKK